MTHHTAFRAPWSRCTCDGQLSANCRPPMSSAPGVSLCLTVSGFCTNTGSPEVQGTDAPGCQKQVAIHPPPTSQWGTPEAHNAAEGSQGLNPGGRRKPVRALIPRLAIPPAHSLPSAPPPGPPTTSHINYLQPSSCVRLRFGENARQGTGVILPVILGS